MTRSRKVLLLGCGFTAKRVAETLLAQHRVVHATSREVAGLRTLERQGAVVHPFDALCTNDLNKLSTIVGDVDAIVCSIPSVWQGETLVDPVQTVVASMPKRPPRAVYLSTTGVYGSQHFVDSSTPPQPDTLRAALRIEAENAILAGFDSPLVLRPAAIYGPGRGVHISLRKGTYHLSGDGTNYISRIYVEDLAAHVLAALDSDITGAWPVADNYPCSQREMAEFCSRLLGVPIPGPAAPASISETLRANRRVDGSEIRNILGITLRFPSYREGVPAAIEEERRLAMSG